MPLTDYANFIGPSYQTASQFVDSERASNLIIEAGQGNTRSKLFYYARPGLKLATPLNASIPQVTALYTTGSNTTYATQANGLYQLSNGGASLSSRLLGNLAAASYDRLSLSSSQTQLLIAQGGSGYIWNGTTIQQITSAGGNGWLGASSVTQILGFFVILGIGANANRIYSSALLDGLTYPAANYALINSPDPPVAIITDQRQLLWVFCQRHVEVYGFNAALTAFPFSSISGAQMQVGLLARLSLVSMDNTLFWLGCDDRGIGGIYRANGFTPQKVSTPAVDDAISSYARANGFSQLQNAEAYCYRDGGHEYYVITFPLNDQSLGQTWCYDASTDMWTERSYWNAPLLIEQAHRARVHTYNAAWNMHLVGDYASGNIYEQNSAFYDDFQSTGGQFIRRLRTAPVILATGKRMFFKSFQLDMQVGDAANYLTAPSISLSYSDDGGRTYKSERTISTGKIGEYQTRVRDNQLGSGYQRNYRVIQTDPVQTAWTAAWLEMSAAA